MSEARSSCVPGGSAHSLREIVDIIAGILGKRVLTVPVPLGLAEAAVGLQEKLLSHPVIRREQIQRLREDKQYEYSPAADDLGYSPMQFNDGAAKLIRAMGFEVRRK